MREDNKDFDKEYDSLKDVIDFQNNMFNPGHYIGTGRVMPIVSAPGNATPMAVVCFISTILSIAFELVVLFSDLDTIDKIILTLIMLGLSAFVTALGIGYLKKSLRYRKQKTKIEEEYVDNTVKDEIWQRTCPKCGIKHDIDYPKCPNCKYNYLDI